MTTWSSPRRVTAGRPGTSTSAAGASSSSAPARPRSAWPPCSTSCSATASRPAPSSSSAARRRPLRHIEVLEASHPVPDETSLAGGLRLLELAEDAGPDDLAHRPRHRRQLGARGGPGRGPLARRQGRDQPAAARLRRRHRLHQQRAQAPLAHQGRAPGACGRVRGRQLHGVRRRRRPARRRHRPHRARTARPSPTPRPSATAGTCGRTCPTRVAAHLRARRPGRRRAATASTA